VGSDYRYGEAVNRELRDGTPQRNHALPLSVRVREACRLTGIGRSKLYELIAARHIEVIKVGAITLIPTRSLQCFLEARSGPPSSMSEFHWRQECANSSPCAAAHEKP
jgi:excisionase family DNA binding protein